MFDIVGFIWPPPSPDAPTIDVIVFLKAETKDIFTEHLKATLKFRDCLVGWGTNVHVPVAYGARLGITPKA